MTTQYCPSCHGMDGNGLNCYDMDVQDSTIITYVSCSCGYSFECEWELTKVDGREVS
jgi:hypothetical protein